MPSSIKWAQYHHLLKGSRGGTDEIMHLKHSAYDLHVASSQYYLLKKISKNKSKRAELWNFQHYPQLWSFIFKITSSRITEEGRDQLSNFTLRKRDQNNLYVIMKSITRNKRCHRQKHRIWANGDFSLPHSNTNNRINFQEKVQSK